MGVSRQRHAPAELYSRGKDPGTHCTGGWVGPRAGLDTEARGKILCHCRGSNLDRPVVQPVVRHYTAWATRLPLSEATAPGWCHKIVTTYFIWHSQLIIIIIIILSYLSPHNHSIIQHDCHNNKIKHFCKKGVCRSTVLWVMHFSLMET
jgi:hypothetical protein